MNREIKLKIIKMAVNTGKMDISNNKKCWQKLAYFGNTYMLIYNEYYSL